MRRFIIIIFIILFVVALVLVLRSSKDESLKIPENNTNTIETDLSASSNASVDFTTSSPQVNVAVNGGNFSFTPNIIKVKEGDTLNITFVNDEGFHDLKIDEFNVATKQIKANEQETVSFIADKKGSFEYYCSVGTHRQMGMKGTLVVE